MLWISAIVATLTFCYFLVSVSLLIGVWRLKRKAVRLEHLGDSGESVGLPFVSILVPARNEERSIADCLESLVRQQYPSDRYEIVVVNDRSTDRTPDIINSYREKYKTVKCVNIDSNPSGLTGKQNALKEGLRFCKGEIILNTDADCIAGPLWVGRTASHFTPQVGLTIGFSTTYNMDGSRSFFSDLQSLDMLFLMDSAAGAIGMNVPVSCLGRNLAYRKVILSDIDYPGTEYTVTEDAALIQMVAKEIKWDIDVVYEREASVSTVAEKTAKQLLSQRIRWVMGGQAAGAWSQIPLHAVFLFHLCLAIMIPLVIFVPSLIAVTMFSFFIKGIMDFIRCWRVCRNFDKIGLLRLSVPYEMFMISYSILAGIGSIFLKRVRWKGEVYTRNARLKPLEKA